ncbi:MAG: hypothetical protein IKF59_13505 [Lachnospiraceae bacterium]|nr:hypothetical protein [Lachnospiraceae bacterium]
MAICSESFPDISLNMTSETVTMNYERSDYDPLEKATMFLLKERPLPPEKTSMASEKSTMTSKKAAKAVRISLTAPLPHQINQINYLFNFYSL